MAYTETDLTNVETAIRSLMAGTRKVRLSMGDKMIEYARTDLNDLIKLKQEIINEMQCSTGTSRYILTKSEKGL